MWLHKSRPLSPMTRNPPPDHFSPSPSSSGGRRLPVHQVKLTGGRPARSGNPYLTSSAAGNPSALAADPSAEILVGARKSSPENTESRMWQAMSPKPPVPKSRKRRHANGTYALL